MNKVIFVDAGHSKKAGDPGAVSGKFIEFDLNAAVAKACFEYLKAHYNCTPVIDFDNTIGTNCRKAKELKAAAFLCIHHNAGGGDGGEVYYYPTDLSAKKLAEITAVEFKAIGQNYHGAPVKPGAKFGVCVNNAKNGIPAILGEFAFVDGINDRTIIDSAADLQREGEAYARAVAKFLKLPAKSTAPKTTPAPVIKTESKAQFMSYMVSVKALKLYIKDAPDGTYLEKYYKWRELLKIIEVKTIGGNQWGRTADGWIALWLTKPV